LRYLRPRIVKESRKLRITAGKFGGRTLQAPGGVAVRPTSDKVRQAIFNVIAHKDLGFAFALEGVRCVDLFAGTGAFGLEALSRGATFALFIEADAASRAVIRENVEALGLTGASKIWRRDASALGKLDTLSAFGLAFLDPPYRKGLIAPALASLSDGGWLAKPALVIAEMSEAETLSAPSGYETLDERVYGETRVLFLRAG